MVNNSLFTYSRHKLRKKIISSKINRLQIDQMTSFLSEIKQNLHVLPCLAFIDVVHLFKNDLNYLSPKEESFIFAGEKMNSDKRYAIIRIENR